MTNQINDGGPAFPCPPSQHSNGFYSTGNGMSLRDYFAAAIMQGLMASQWQVDDPYPIYAYKIADAMIQAREVK